MNKGELQLTSGEPERVSRVLPESVLAGFRRLPAYLDPGRQQALIDAVLQVAAAAPFYKPSMPKTGKPFSVAMTNCGPLGWVSDKDGGYRYQPNHPVTGAPWPAMPASILALWDELAEFPAPPEACLINHYAAAGPFKESGR